MKDEIKELEYGIWYDISLYFKYFHKLDWALVQFEEKLKDESKFKGRFYPLPRVCEYIKYEDARPDGQWVTEDYDPLNGVGEEEVKYINEQCKPVAFMLWKPFDESYVFNAVNVENKRIKELEGKCAKLTTLVGQLTYELFEEKLDDIVKEREND